MASVSSVDALSEMMSSRSGSDWPRTDSIARARLGARLYAGMPIDTRQLAVITSQAGRTVATIHRRTVGVAASAAAAERRRCRQPRQACGRRQPSGMTSRAVPATSATASAGGSSRAYQPASSPAARAGASAPSRS
jgi:hypothetical protein